MILNKKMLEEKETDGFFAWDDLVDQLERNIRKSKYIKKRSKKLLKEKSRQTNANTKRRRYFK